MTVNAVSNSVSAVANSKLKNKNQVESEVKNISVLANALIKTTGENGFTDWLTDKDKICTDRKDDGNLSFKEAMKSVGKGYAGVLKSAINHPVATAVTVGLGVAATVVTGGAILPVMVVAGAATGIGLIGYGSYKAATAKTDGEAKQAFETIGNGGFTLTASILSAKPAVDKASHAGVNVKTTSNPYKATAECFKATPDSLKFKMKHNY